MLAIPDHRGDFKLMWFTCMCCHGHVGLPGQCSAVTGDNDIDPDLMPVAFPSIYEHVCDADGQPS